MVKFINKIPAGTLLVPMLVSALLFTIWPNLFFIGGLTEEFFSGKNVGFIVGMICFVSGVSIDFNTLKLILKRQGVLSIAKIVMSILLSLGYIALFGQEGIFGISALAFTVGINSVNGALYLSVVRDFGTKIDQAAFSIIGLLGIPVVPIFIYSLQGEGSFDWMPILSALIPVVFGMVLGNLDKGFVDIFGSGLKILIPILGWNLGQGMNLLLALQSGIGGIIFVGLFYILTSPLIFLDKKILGNDGVAAFAMNAVAGVSTAYPMLIARTNPFLMPFVTDATSQLLTAAILTAILTPIFVGKYHDSIYKL
ncbi:2-keto-3-deoxygluconate permease [Carnobacteriaceae bacterium 52-44]